MPKVSLTTTVEVVQDVKLKPQAKVMVLARCEEHAQLAKQAKAIKARMGRIKEETQDIFRAEKQGKALMTGCTVDGHKLKMVVGKRKKLDHGLLMELGCLPEWLKEATTELDNEPYIKITAPNETDEE